jgi:hypothetical protein
MLTQADVDILHVWRTCPLHEQRRVKCLLMPDDPDAVDMLFHVVCVEHMDIVEIKVFRRREGGNLYRVCEIRVRASTGEAEYDWETRRGWTDADGERD